MTAFVTGGGGFIGRRLRDGGHDVRAIARSESSATRLRATGCDRRRIGPDLGETVTASASVTYWATDAKARRELGYAPRNLEVGLAGALG